MAKRWMIVFLALFLLGCTKTEIVSENVATVEGNQTETAQTNVTTQTSGGAAVGEQAATGCADTDEGIDKVSRGTVSGTYEDGTLYELIDKCYGSVYLVEYYCDEDQPSSQNFRCENGCKSGICV